MGSGAPDSMWIREINTIKAERDKAIADREKISRILHEREEVGQRQIDELLRRLEYEKKDKEVNEFPIRSRWVKLSEREPDHDSEVFARKTAEDFLTVIYFAEEGDIKYSVNGESYIFADQLDEWEWLELRQKEKPESAVPLPDGSELSLPHVLSNWMAETCIKDCGGGMKWNTKPPVEADEMDNSEPVVPVTDERPDWLIGAERWYEDMRPFLQPIVEI
ncbi:MAG: hypothetical protein PHS31_09005, partial [Victivallaceae bacterium]|nr:hypothetical protein [Victivallaceae bacterium]